MRLASTGRVESRSIESRRIAVDADHHGFERAQIDVTQIDEFGVGGE